MSHDPSDLLARATAGTLSAREKKQVVADLEHGAVDPYDGLLVIGRAGMTEQRPLVERYLESRSDPMLARLAVQVLCRYWGLYSEYRSVLARFVGKVDWDTDDDVRLMAIGCAGSLLASLDDRPLLELLLSTFQDVEERQIVREAAYCALGEAAGKRPEELPPASRHFDLEGDIDPAVIAGTRARLARE